MNYFDFGLDAFVTEAFYGKDKRFLKCEEALEMIRSDIRSGGGYARRIDDSEGNELLQKTLCDIFGFRKMLIHWDISVTMANSNWTLPTCAVVMEGKAILGKLPFDKVPYDKNHSMTCVMDCSQSLFKIMSNAQILAVILHETGHNFEVNPYKAIQFVIQTITLVSNNIKLRRMFDTGLIPPEYLNQAIDASTKNIVKSVGSELLFTTNPGKPIYMFFSTLWDRIMQATTGLAKISQFFGKIAMGINRWCMVYLAPLTTLTVPIAAIVAPFGQAATVATRKGEQFADSFAAAYGYGTELSEALDLLSKYYVAPGPDYYKKANPFKKFLYNLGVANVEILQMLANDHGSAMSRTASMLDELRKSLDDTDLTMEQKKELNKEIEKLEEAYVSYGRLKDGENGNIAVATRSFIMKYFDGSLGLWEKLLPDLKQK